MMDPYFADMKQHKRDTDWLYAIVDSHYCIPKKCTCGGAITVETDERGRNYYVCKVFEDDGLHILHACLDAIEEELNVLKREYADEVLLRCKLKYELGLMREEIKELKKLFMEGR
ncbi:hypothetical protein Bca4012_020093 [Brassica carinata]|uniref:Uncharacterized protein n=1 Tax=Brassica carinata TaxID=52824 RepID=A0A8X7WG51_BRACI|nr:hypothetical protein Bca52824_001483 [Brassica carinata]